MDILFHHANVLTMSEGSPPAESLLVRGGRVAAVGPASLLRPEMSRGAREIDLGGRTVIPGFTDSHLHFVQVGLGETRLRLENTRSIAQVQELVGEALRAAPPPSPTDVPGVKKDADRPSGAGGCPFIVRGEGWDESSWPEGRHLRRSDIDAVTTDVPVLLRRVCGHMAVANARGAELVAEQGGDIDPGTGIMLEETALNLDVILPPSPEEEDRAVERASLRAASLGVTAVHDLARLSHVAAYERARRRGTLATRVVVHQWHPDRDPESPFPGALRQPDELLWRGGVKMFVDGSLGARTAALYEPYCDDPGNRGLLLWERPALERLLARAGEAGRPLLIHAIGDRAVAVSLEAIGAVLAGGPNRLGHRVEHAELIREEDMIRMAELGVIASVQPNFAGTWCDIGGMYDARLGRERARRANPLASLRRKGVRLAFGSDGMPFSPWVGLNAALRHPNPSERFESAEALRLYTRAGAEIVPGEAPWGSLAPGRWADLAVFRGELTAGEEGPLDRLSSETPRVELTMLAGEVVYVSEEFRPVWEGALRGGDHPG